MRVAAPAPEPDGFRFPSPRAAMTLQPDPLQSLPPAGEIVVHALANAIEVAGIGIIVVSALVASLVFARGALGPAEFHDAYRRYRGNLGRGILLGLEFLVAADIIGTVAVEPTFENLGVLGVIVLIRTFLSFALEVEINGHWPWQESRHRTAPPEERL